MSRYLRKIWHRDREMSFITDEKDSGFADMRAATLLTKEPETIKWLDTLHPNDVFWDVGACLGTYTIYAAIMAECKVYGFEPSANNFFRLQQNVFLNEVEDLVSVYPIAIGTKLKYDSLLYNQPYVIGSSGNDVKSSKYARKPNRHRGGCVVDSINNLVNRGLEYPTYLKIDVDGTEPDVINGALKVLPNLKSILIELYSTKKNDLKLVKKIESRGFYLDEELFNISAERHDKTERWSGMRNYIFWSNNAV